jgi:predicted secreted protein
MSAAAERARQRILLPAIWMAACAWSGLANAQPMAIPAPANVVQIDASGFKEVPQDWLTMRLTTTESGTDAGTVQNQLKVAIESALVVARAQAKPGLLEVRTGQFSLYPRYGSGGKINGWQGTTELVLEGRDFARISSTAGKITTLTMGGVSFSLSREARQQLESEVQAQAIERFRARAAEVAKGFGFSGYTLREIGISSADAGGDVVVRPRVMAMEAKAAMSDAPVPVEAGKSMVNVTVSGTIQLR